MPPQKHPIEINQLQASLDLGIWRRILLEMQLPTGVPLYVSEAWPTGPRGDAAMAQR